MKTVYIVLASLFLFISCEEKDGKRDTSFLTDSTGNINSLLVVTSNDLWNGSVGEKLRDYFAAPTDGLPQQEPLFSMTQIPPSTYSGFSRNYRTFLHVKMGDSNSFSIKKNSYAKPQLGAFITATSEEKMIQLMDQNYEEIIRTFKAGEIKEKQRRTRLSLLPIDSLKERFGVNLEISSVYRVAAASDDFYWIRKDLKSGSTNILVYEVPLNAIGKDSTIIGDIIKIRDSIGSGYLPVEDDGRFITEEAYAPYLFSSELDGKFAYETKGTWELKDQYMAGPFVNYAVRDESKNRYLIIEGFTYAPTVGKRDLQFELEAIIKSAKFE